MNRQITWMFAGSECLYDHSRKFLCVGKTQVCALPGQRMHCVRRIAGKRQTIQDVAV